MEKCMVPFKCDYELYNNYENDYNEFINYFIKYIMLYTN